jgi:hypothetical protein
VGVRGHVSVGRATPPARSLAGRALLAAVLFVGFYVLALVVIGVLLLIPYVEYRTAGRVHIQLVVICLIGVGLIVASVWP